jgi:hypothetical protein
LIRCKSDHFQALTEIDQEMGDPFESISSANVDQVLDNDGLLTRERPQNGCGDPWQLVNDLE